MRGRENFNDQDGACLLIDSVWSTEYNKEVTVEKDKGLVGYPWHFPVHNLSTRTNLLSCYHVTLLP
jgi:hypothetical protein